MYTTREETYQRLLEGALAINGEGAVTDQCAYNTPSPFLLFAYNTPSPFRCMLQEKRPTSACWRELWPSMWRGPMDQFAYYAPSPFLLFAYNTPSPFRCMLQGKRPTSACWRELWPFMGRGPLRIRLPKSWPREQSKSKKITFLKIFINFICIL